MDIPTILPFADLDMFSCNCKTCTDRTYTYGEDFDTSHDYGHWPECEMCSRTFKSKLACNEHMTTMNHWKPRFACQACNLGFHSQQAADKHIDDAGHWKHYCSGCDRRFKNEHNMRTVS